MASSANRANFEIELYFPDRVVLRDVGPWDRHLTITNDAESVVADIAPILRGRRLFYYDSDGELGILRVVDGKFAGFV